MRVNALFTQYPATQQTNRAIIAGSTAKKLKSALEVPAFASDEEAAHWFDTHDASEFWDQLLPARPIKLPPEQIREIRERYERRCKIAEGIRREQKAR